MGEIGKGRGGRRREKDRESNVRRWSKYCTYDQNGVISEWHSVVSVSMSGRQKARLVSVILFKL